MIRLEIPPTKTVLVSVTVRLKEKNPVIISFFLPLENEAPR